MSYAMDKKLEKLIMMKDFAVLEKKPPKRVKDLLRLKAKQDKAVHELMAHAYDIPFYRRRPVQVPRAHQGGAAGLDGPGAGREP